MPTIFTHGAIGFTASRLAPGLEHNNWRVTAASVLLAALPDADALFRRWIPYGNPLGHRGLTHSLLFALVVGTVAALLFSLTGWAGSAAMRKLVLLFTLVIASHGFFDAMTDGGLGIAFFAPFDNSRYFLPWRPIPVAPLSAQGLFRPDSLNLILWELVLFWTFAGGAALWSRRSWRPTAVALWAAGAVMWVVALSLRA